MFAFLRTAKKKPHPGAKKVFIPRKRIPGINTCIQLMDKHGMLDNIRHHSLVVARIADRLSLELLDDPITASAGERALILAGALLHDIAKTGCLDGSCDHAAVGAELCHSHGYPEIAAIVEEHVILKEHDPDRYRCGVFTPREIVYYADKRVRHTQIVSLEERLEYILERYGNNDPERYRLIRENFQRCLELEEALFRALPFKADELEKEIHFPRLPDKILNDPWA